MASRIPQAVHEETLVYIKENYTVIDGLLSRNDGYIGSLNKDGHRQFKIRLNDNSRMTVVSHHVAWFLHHGVWPTLEVDHKDRNKANNSKDNLRGASSSLNSLNKNRKMDLPPGVKLKKGRYEAYMWIHGKQTYLGSSKYMLEAAQIYRRMHLELYGEDVFEMLDCSRWDMRGDSEI